MRMTIAERLAPFSHQPGSYCLIPGSSVAVQVYPSYLRFNDCGSQKQQLLAELELPLSGPIRQFTVQLDLERGAVKVWGKSAQGYFRYQLICQEGAIRLVLEKGPAALQELASWKLEHKCSALSIPQTRLSLGSHRQQDMEMALRRRDMASLLPCLLRLGHLIPPTPEAPKPYQGTLSLLGSCQELFAERPELIHEALEDWIAAGFEGILKPRLADSDHLGLVKVSERQLEAYSPLQLLSEGAKFIQALFLQETSEGIAVLPSLPPEFHAGRFLDVDCGQVAKLSLEWSKKRPRRLIVDAKESGELPLIFRQGIKSFRLRKTKADRGVRCDVMQALRLEAGQRYFLDRLER